MMHKFSVNFKLIDFLLWIKGSHQSPNFETFECSGENFWNSSCHFWKHKSVLLQILHQYLVSSNTIPLYFISSNIIHFGQRQPIKVQILKIFECSCQNSLNFLISISNWQVNSSSNFASLSSVMKDNSFLVQTLYILVKSIALKFKFLRLLSARVKILQIHYVNFETASQFLFKFFIILQCHYSCIFYFWQKNHNFWHFQVFWWKFTKFLMSFSKPQVSFSSNITWHFNVMKYNSLVLFWSNLSLA